MENEIEKIWNLSDEDKFFRCDLPDNHNNACLNYEIDDFGKWHCYIAGFGAAADSLAEQVLSRRLPLDTHIYPVIFLYRHHFELVLKAVIGVGQELDRTDWGITPSHRLNELWTQARTILHELTPGGSCPRYLDIAGRLIAELSDMDTGSYAFRYPVDRCGEPSINKKLINFRNFVSVAHRLRCFLGAGLGELRQQVDILLRMRG